MWAYCGCSRGRQALLLSVWFKFVAAVLQFFGCFTACGEWNVDGERLWVWLVCTHQPACGMLCSCTTVFMPVITMPVITNIHHDVLLEAAAKRFVSQHTVLRYGTADGTAEHNMNMVVGMCSARVI